MLRPRILSVILVLTALSACGDAGQTEREAKAVSVVEGRASAPYVPTEVRALAKGAIETLIVRDEPRPFREKTFKTLKGKSIDLHQFDGQVTLLNFWATWCTPCREEMPALARLHAELAGSDFQVVTINLDRGRGGVKKAQKFFQEIEVDLPLYVDPTSNLARHMGVLNLPVTVILNREAREIARLTGPAEWDAPEAEALLRHVISLAPAETGGAPPAASGPFPE